MWIFFKNNWISFLKISVDKAGVSWYSVKAVFESCRKTARNHEFLKNWKNWKNQKTWKKLLTIQKTDDIILELRLRKTQKDKKQEQKLSKGFEKKLKKFLTSRKQHDKISKLSVRRQDKKWTLITEQWNTFLESSFKS